MSDSSWTRVPSAPPAAPGTGARGSTTTPEGPDPAAAPPAAGAPSVAPSGSPGVPPFGGREAAPGLLRSLEPLLRGWLPRQRWFAGKGLPIGGFRLAAATELMPPGGKLGPLGLLHVLVDVEQPGRPADCYQLLLGAHPLLPSALVRTALGRAVGGPYDGLTLYDAPHDPRLAALLLERLRMPGRTGRLHFSTEPHAVFPPAPAPRVSTAEQSNTSVVYGDAYILKLFRRVSPGTNPDLELSLALARAGSRRVAEPVAWFESLEPGPGPAAEEPTTLGLLQRFLPGSSDGWALALASVAEDGDFRAEAAALGRATAEVHASLAAALPVRALGGAALERIAAGMARRLDETAAEVPAVRPYAAALRSAFDDLAKLGAGTLPGHAVTAQRIHGDLHLGQALRGPDGEWVLIDFEGEPARPLAERRRPAPPVQDVAGMLRSFDYAAHHSGNGPWAARHRDAYCTGYAAVSGIDPREQPVLIRAFETDKAVYEARYEARHRPAWLPIPLSALARLATAAPR
ncbi:maltokinase [Streptomyces cocklensis]|uniref:Maltokinase n=1 Tax=Actinacidiphila cocklensis TaxID=887465 RepID=A0A9W4DQ83_9ACTN|nr:maltokinase [Actinacidiphila cocklensis]MDD1060226.1 maltokinase [Actinacidiphila cocklensis]WSX76656.1 maltokinase [Streptomyces sp. NBC_00899]CAG6394288.1 Maltokinase [Actinacidiphila cocklensis]